eukprot:gene3149-6194_t
MDKFLIKGKEAIAQQQENLISINNIEKKSSSSLYLKNSQNLSNFNSTKTKKSHLKSQILPSKDVVSTSHAIGHPLHTLDSFHPNSNYSKPSKIVKPPLLIDSSRGRAISRPTISTTAVLSKSNRIITSTHPIHEHTDSNTNTVYTPVTDLNTKLPPSHSQSLSSSSSTLLASSSSQSPPRKRTNVNILSVAAVSDLFVSALPAFQSTLLPPPPPLLDTPMSLTCKEEEGEGGEDYTSSSSLLTSYKEYEEDNVTATDKYNVTENNEDEDEDEDEILNSTPSSSSLSMTLPITDATTTDTTSSISNPTSTSTSSHNNDKNNNNNYSSRPIKPIITNNLKSLLKYIDISSTSRSLGSGSLSMSASYTDSESASASSNTNTQHRINVLATTTQNLTQQTVESFFIQSNPSSSTSSSTSLSTSIKSTYSTYSTYRSIPHLSDNFTNMRLWSHIGGRPRASTARFCAHRFRPSMLKLQRVTYASGREVYGRVGVSCVKFDREGVLVAVGGSNGILRVFDFDMCQMLMNGSSNSNSHNRRLDPGTRSVPPLPPVMWIDTRKDISGLDWNPAAPDEIAVSFTYSPVIHIYDLGRSAEPCRVLCVRHCNSGGHLHVCYFGSAGEFVLAGGGTGSIRMWDGKRPQNVLWEVHGDPVLNTAMAECAIVGIRPGNLANDTIIAMTRSGVISIWDTKKMIIESFGSNSLPTCVYRMNIWDGVLFSDIPPTMRFSVINMNMFPTTYTSVYITLSSNDVYIIDLLNRGDDREIIPAGRGMVQPPRVKTSNVVMLGVDSDQTLRDGNKYLNAQHCSAIFPVWMEKMSVTPLHGTVSLRFQNFGNDIYNNTNISTTNTNSSTIKNSSNGGGSSSGITDASKSMSMSMSVPKMKRSSSMGFTLTLPGAVHTATTGSCDLFVSNDLRSFLSTSTSSSTYSVECITASGIRLNRPYEGGPDVIDGYPRVYIRTDLLPSSSYSSSDHDQTHAYTHSHMHTHVQTGVESRIAPDLDVTAPVTALESHPTMPYLILGLYDDEVVILKIGW